MQECLGCLTLTPSGPRRDITSHTGRYPFAFTPVAGIGVDITIMAQTPDHSAIKRDDLLSYE